MSRWVVLLRGINVGGINIKMADVRTVLTAAGFTNVRTILATGNVLLDSAADSADVTSAVQRVLADSFGYEAWVIVMDEPNLRRIVDAYPFDAEREGWHPYVLFGTDSDHLAELSALSPTLDDSVERIALGDGVVYWEVLRGSTTDSAFGKATAKAKFKPTTTTRNVRTLVKILA